jgi:DNA polymerase III delta prime subunit
MEKCVIVENKSIRSETKGEDSMEQMAYQKAAAVITEVKKAVTGKDDCVVKAFAAILAGGHILVEDVPGVGKTTLAMAFSRALALNNHRVQFTPDVMPADILGFSMYQKETGTFSYHPGTIMCNLFLADEINRTSPKTQSHGGGGCHGGRNRSCCAEALCGHRHPESQGKRRNPASAGIPA